MGRTLLDRFHEHADSASAIGCERLIYTAFVILYDKHDNAWHLIGLLPRTFPASTAPDKTLTVRPLQFSGRPSCLRLVLLLDVSSNFIPRRFCQVELTTTQILKRKSENRLRATERRLHT